MGNWEATIWHVCLFYQASGGSVSELNIEMRKVDVRTWIHFSAADGIYFACNHLIVPHRRRRECCLSALQITENNLFSFERARVEHVSCLYSNGSAVIKFVTPCAHFSGKQLCWTPQYVFRSQVQRRSLSSWRIYRNNDQCNRLVYPNGLWAEEWKWYSCPRYLTPLCLILHRALISRQ